MRILAPAAAGTTRDHRSRATRSLVAAVMLVAVILASGCSRDSRATQTLTVTGSTTLLPIAEIAGEGFEEANQGTRVLVSAMGSSAGIESAAKGTSDIGTSSRDLKDEEAGLGLVDTPIAYDAIAVIVNKDNPVQSLTTEQVKAIFQGTITNWREVGGPDLQIDLVNRDEASGTREAFSKIVLDKEPFDSRAAVLPGTGQVRAVVSNSRGAVGYISVGFIDDNVKAVDIDGVTPSVETVISGEYPIRRVLHFFTKGQPGPLAKRYIDFVLSAAVQDTVVRDAGFIPITAGEGLEKEVTK